MSTARVILITSLGRRLVHVAFTNARYKRPKLKADVEQSSYCELSSFEMLETLDHELLVCCASL